MTWFLLGFSAVFSAFFPKVFWKLVQDDLDTYHPDDFEVVCSKED